MTQIDKKSYASVTGHRLMLFFSCAFLALRNQYKAIIYSDSL